MQEEVLQLIITDFHHFGERRRTILSVTIVWIATITAKAIGQVVVVMIMVRRRGFPVEMRYQQQQEQKQHREGVGYELYRAKNDNKQGGGKRGRRRSRII